MDSTINSNLENDLENMFKKMSGPGKLQTEERQKAFIRFTTNFAEKQNSFKAIFDKPTQIPPELGKKTVKNITEATQQFDPMVAFIHEKEKEIDASATNLVQFNKEMNTAITNFVNTQI